MAHVLETNGYESINPIAPPASDPSPSIESSFDALDNIAFKGWSCQKERRADRPLSPRERQILTLIIDGKTPKEVAYDLQIAHSTVRVIYSRAMKKLGGHWQPTGGRG
jgi:DNA-binding NarL/FixJ family response regulator